MQIDLAKIDLANTVFEIVLPCGCRDNNGGLVPTRCKEHVREGEMYVDPYFPSSLQPCASTLPGKPRLHEYPFL